MSPTAPGKDRALARGLIAALLAVLTGAAVLYPPPVPAPGAGPRITGEIQHFTLLRKPRPLPEVPFTDAAGAERTLADFRGRVVLLNFWATWCAPCIREMPSLDRLARRLEGPDFAVVALSQDRGAAAVARPFYARLGLDSLKLYLDPKGRVQRALGVTGLPTTVLIDARGREIGRLEGPAEWTAPEAVALIRHYLKSEAEGRR